jgi:hypothetical protein
MNRIHTKIIGLVLMFVMLLAFTVPSWAAISWQQKNSRFTGLAGETLVAGDVVAILPSTGAIWKADADVSTLRPAVGVIGKGGAAGAYVEVVVSGVITGMTAASPGARLFLDAATAGAITTTAPTNAQALGWVLPGSAAAATSTKYYIHLTIPNSAGAAY